MSINRIELKYDSLYVVGDIHGAFNKIVEFIKHYDIRNTCIVVAGDCGLGFGCTNVNKESVKKLNWTCGRYDDYIILVRGNHDNPDYFNSGTVNSKRIIAVPDYTVLNGTVLLVGGAISVDRIMRTTREKRRFDFYNMYHPEVTLDTYRELYGGVYWDNESPYYDESAFDDIKSLRLDINHVVTHTCPSVCMPTNKDGIMQWLAIDDTLEKDIDNERKVMDLILNRLVNDGHHLHTWTYGHYHNSNVEVIDGVKFTMLNAIIHQNSVVDWVAISSLKI